MTWIQLLNVIAAEIIKSLLNLHLIIKDMKTAYTAYNSVVITDAFGIFYDVADTTVRAASNNK